MSFDDGFCRASPPLFGEPMVVNDAVGTTYMSLLWGMAEFGSIQFGPGEGNLEGMIPFMMPCHDHYNYAGDQTPAGKWAEPADPNVFDDVLDGPTCERCGIYPAATCECDE